MLRSLSIVIALSVASLDHAQAACPAPPPAGDALQRIDAAAQALRDCRRTGTISPAQAQASLGRLAALRDQVRGLRHRQGGTLSSDQQARVLARLAAVG
jgi:hypothetical protein